MTRLAIVTAVKILSRSGMTVRAISDDVGISKTTVHRMIHEETRGRKRTAQKKRAPSKTVKARRRAARQLALQTERIVGNPGKTSRSERTVVYRRTFGSVARIARELRRRAGKKRGVSNSTVYRDLKASGLVSKRKPRGPYRREPDAKDRVAFAKKELGRALPIFSDESMIDVNNHGPASEWCTKKQAPAEREYYNFAPKVHVWGAIGIGFKKLIFMPAAAITADTYKRKCLMPLVGYLKERNLRFQQDNARVHTACVDYLKSKKIDVLDWPARSPDLSPIETMWAILKQRVSHHGPSNVTQLRAFVEREWDAISQKTVDALVRTFPARLKAAIHKKGLTITTAERRRIEKHAK